MISQSLNDDVMMPFIFDNKTNQFHDHVHKENEPLHKKTNNVVSK